MNEITSFEAATPAMIVGRTFDGSIPPLGLGEPFALLGRDRLGPSGIAFDIMHDHQPQFIDWIARACRTQLEADRPWFRAPPIALTGPAGAGRTHAARCLAATFGAPHAVINLTDPLIAANIAASRGVAENLWAFPSTVSMAATRCANPVITVIGADRVEADVASGLAALIDPGAGQCLMEDRLGISVDLSQVTWVLQCDEPGKIRSAISKGIPVVTLSRPPDGIDTVLALSIFREAMEDCRMEMADPTYSWGRIRSMLPDRHFMHAKSLYADMVNAITQLKLGPAPSLDDFPF